MSTFKPATATLHPKVLALAAALTLFTLGQLNGSAQSVIVTPITGLWRYSPNNFTSTNWMAAGYDDSNWYGPGAALFFIEDSTLIPAPFRTPLPSGPGGGAASTYYFRSTFVLTNLAGALTVTFSNLVDDGGVFYLNGREIKRVRMAPGPTTYASLATGPVPGGDAETFEVFQLTGQDLTNLVQGVNSIAVEIHQSSTNDSDIVFGSAISVTYAPPAASLTRGPYLQLSTPTNITLCWRTDVASSSRVIYGTNLAALNQTNANPALETNHFITLTGLLPDTRYYYGVGTTHSNLAGLDSNHFFWTHPWPGTEKPVRIWVIGDAGTASANQQAVRDAFYTFNGTNTVHAWLQLGDNAYVNGTDAEYQAAVFNMYPTLLRNSVSWPTLGNHDTAEGLAYVDTYPYFNIFALPTAGEAGGVPSGTEHYYSFDLGMVHFICLDSMTASRATNGAMALWLRSDLTMNTNRWTVAFWHHPPYTKGSHNSDTEVELIEMRQNFLPILESGGVDLVLCGHSHSYERSYLINGHYGLSGSFDTNTMLVQPGSGRETNGSGAYLKLDGFGGVPVGHRGAIYAVAGSSGQISGVSTMPAMFASQNLLGSMVLDFASNQLDATFLPTSGVPSDTFRMVKTAAHPPQLGRLQAGAAGFTRFTIWSRQNTTNVIESTTALDGAAAWEAIGTNVPALPSFIYSDTNAPNSPQRFYRVRQE